MESATCGEGDGQGALGDTRAVIPRLEEMAIYPNPFDSVKESTPA
ncbi:hypothetical protein ACWC0C_34520 [Streptomyces sp. NPDC001709]